jgi:hypothetical protein
LEYRSKDDRQIKLYEQLRKVKYADYKIGFYYISPEDLVLEDGTSIPKRSQVTLEGFL